MRKKKEDKISMWWVIILCLPLLLVFSYATLVTSGVIDPYANQRIEKNFTLRSVKLWEDPRWTEDKLLVSTYGAGVFFLEGNISCQLNVGDAYRMIYKNVEGTSDIPFYYVFTIELID